MFHEILDARLVRLSLVIHGQIHTSNKRLVYSNADQIYCYTNERFRDDDVEATDKMVTSLF